MPRKLLDWEWYTDPNTFMLFVHCLLKANWRDSMFMGHLVRRGDFATSLGSLANATGLSIKQVRTALSHLRMSGELADRREGNYRVITVVHYDQYQDMGSFGAENGPCKGSLPAPIEEKKELNNLLSVSSTNVSDTDCQPRAAAGADAALFAGPPEGTDETDKSAGAAMTVEPDPDLEAVNAGKSLKGVPAVSRDRERIGEIRRVIDAWNTLESVGIKGITSISPDSRRFHALHARLNHHGVDKVLAAIELVRKSDFLRGANKRGWVITFDWFVRPNNFTKVLDGNYANRSPLAVIGSLDTSWLEH